MKLFSRLVHWGGRWSLLLTGLSLVCLVPVLVAQEPEEPRFDVASVRLNNSGTAVWRYSTTPGRLSVTNGQLEIILMNGFGVERYQLITDQDWVRTERSDIEATSEKPVAGTELNAMLRNSWQIGST